MLVIFEAFWLPLAEQSYRKLWLVSITQQCLPSPPACWAGVVFQPVHHVQCAPAFPRKLEHFIGKALFHNKVSVGYIIGKVRSQMAAVQVRLSSGCGAEPWLWGWTGSKVCLGKVGSLYPCSPVRCHWGKAGDRMSRRTQDQLISSYLNSSFLAPGIQALGKCKVHYGFRQKLFQKHSVVKLMDCYCYNIILIHCITKRKIIRNTRSYVLT